MSSTIYFVPDAFVRVTYRIRTLCNQAQRRYGRRKAQAPYRGRAGRQNGIPYRKHYAWRCRSL
jgi:hypothetical protein